MLMGDLGQMKEVWSHADAVTYMGPTGGIKVGWNEALEVWEAQAAVNRGKVPRRYGAAR